MDVTKILLTNIQRFSLHDGPGIRTTVFTKGCSLRCPWCSNPENMNMIQESYIKDGIKGVYGKYMSCVEIFNEVMKDKGFYGEWDKRGILPEDLQNLSGGVTFSGGEALLQADKLEPLWQRLKEENIHIAIETALMVSAQFVELAMKYIDLFYVDIKVPETKKFRMIIGGDLKKYLENVDYLFTAKKPVVFRIPVIGGYTDSEENRAAVIDIIKKYQPLKVELIKGHNLSNSKYRSLGRKIPEYHEVYDGFMEEYQKMVQELGIESKVCKI